MKLEEINPYIRLTAQSVLPARHRIFRRAIFDYELIYLERGRLKLTYHDTVHLCTPGQFILLRPGISHAFEVLEEELYQPHIHFDLFYTEMSPRIPVSFKDLPQFSEEEKRWIQPDLFAGYPPEPMVIFREPERALALFYSIIARPPLPQLSRKAKLTELMDLLIADNFPECLEQERRSYTVAQQIRDYIDAGQGLTARLCDLEKQFSYSKYWMEQQFRAQYGISLMAYRNEKRMQLAQKLLREDSVTAVTEKLAFSSIYVFSRAFKNRYGISPSEYKKAFQDRS